MFSVKDFIALFNFEMQLMAAQHCEQKLIFIYSFAAFIRRLHEVLRLLDISNLKLPLHISIFDSILSTTN